MKHSKIFAFIILAGLGLTACKKKASKLEVDYAGDLVKIMMVDEFTGGPKEILMGSKMMDFRLATLLSSCQAMVDSTYEVITPDKFHLTHMLELKALCDAGSQIDSIGLHTEKSGYAIGEKVSYSGISHLHGYFNSLNPADTIRIFRGDNHFEGLVKIDELKNSYAAEVDFIYTEVRFHKYLKTIYSGSGTVSVKLTDTNGKSSSSYQGTFSLGSSAISITLDGANYNLPY